MSASPLRAGCLLQEASELLPLKGFATVRSAGHRETEQTEPPAPRFGQEDYAAYGAPRKRADYVCSAYFTRAVEEWSI